jgi:ferrochelatase
MNYDSVLVVSFGGPEKREDVIPFLENVLRGKNVPRERMLEVAEHYYRFGGVSPINAQNREMIAALKTELARNGLQMPVYWGNRNWHPLLADTLKQMQADGIKRALAFVTSAYSSYAGCRQYLDDIAGARARIGDPAPAVEKLRAFFNHPGFIEAMVARAQEALAQNPAEREEASTLIFTAHSIPVDMAQNSNYVQQLEEACRLVSAGLGQKNYRLAYQSRSGPPSQPWLEPDILAVLRDVKATGSPARVVVVPIGFLSDHIEVLYDLDTEAKKLAEESGLTMVRARTVGSHPRFITMIRELIQERLERREKLALGAMGPSHDVCQPDCCTPPTGPDRS